jgi:hypothetical protein
VQNQLKVGGIKRAFAGFINKELKHHEAALSMIHMQGGIFGAVADSATLLAALNMLQLRRRAAVAQHQTFKTAIVGFAQCGMHANVGSGLVHQGLVAAFWCAVSQAGKSFPSWRRYRMK